LGHYEGVSELPFLLVLRCERQQGDIPGLLDRARQTPLVRRTHTGQAPGNNLAPLCNKLLQQPNIPVRDRVNLLRAKLANLLTAEKFAASAGAAAGASALART